MQGFEWAQGNIDAQVEASITTPHELQAQGVNVYFAPNIEADRKLVNLTNGRIEQFFAQEPPPAGGYFADFEGLARFCERHELPLQEIDAQAVMLPAGKHEAGDPLRRGGG